MNEFRKELKFLADVNVERSIIELLKSQGFKVKWVPDLNKSMKDEQVLKLAEDESQILLTNDKDFGEWVFRWQRKVAGVILFRIKGQNPEVKVNLLGKLLGEYQNKLSGYFVVITERRFRFTPLKGGEE